MRIIKMLTIVAVLIMAAVGGGNWIALDNKVQTALSKDVRNNNIWLSAYLDFGVNPNSLVLDLRSIGGDKSMADVDRVLFTALEAMKDYNFEKVILAHRGSRKFQMKGSYAKQIGQEYGFQNPIYTMRTMQENIYKLDGSPAFGSWTGGWLGVMSKQMEDHRVFHEEWYIGSAAR